MTDQHQTVRRIAFGGGIKTLGNGRKGGYLVRFTGPDERDFYGEYFDEHTDFELDDHSPVGKPLLYNHGLDQQFGTKALSHFDTVEVRTEPDEDGNRGIWVEWEEDMMSEKREYLEAAERLNQRSLREYGHGDGLSSGALPQAVEVASNGHIKRWPIIEGSRTPFPADPGNQIQQLKSTADLSALLRERDAREAGPQKVNIQTINLAKQEGETSMTPEQLRELVESVVAEYMNDMRGDLEDEAARMDDEDEMRMSGDEPERMSDEDYDKAAAVVAERALTLVQADTGFQDAQDKTEAAKRVLKARETDLFREIADAVFSERETRRTARREAIRAAREEAMRNAPGVSQTEEAGLRRQSGTAQVSEPMRYAHLSDEKMALAIKIAMSVYPEHQRSRLRLRDLDNLSDEFKRAVVHRVGKRVHSMQAPQRNDVMRWMDYQAMRTAVPFRADELNATDITNQGLEWVTIFYDSQLWERARFETGLFDLMVSKGMKVTTIPDGADTVEFKIDTASPTVYTRRQANDIDATGRPEATAAITPFQTGKVTVAAAEHVLATSTTDRLVEDSIISILQYIDSDAVQTLAEATERTLINGDTVTTADTNINLIDGTPGTGNAQPDYLAWDGFRKQAFTDSKAVDNLNALAMTDFTNTRALFDKPIRSRKDSMVCIIDDDTETAVRNLPEIFTVDVAGANRATMYTGDLPAVLDGVSIYTSGLLDLSNAAGAISSTPANNTRGQINYNYAPYWAYARKRALNIETARDILSGTTVIVASVRHVAKARGANASVLRYNVAV